MTLALFDLDNTLLSGDSDYAWGQFMVSKGLVDTEVYARKNEDFYQDYLRGELDNYAYQEFSLEPLKGRRVSEIDKLHLEFMKEVIEPMLLPKAQDLIEEHRNKNDRLVVITATNRVIAGPIVVAFGIENLVCTETSINKGCYSGELVDEPCMGAGKVSKLDRWIKAESETLEDACFYSDSHNDLPLLSLIDRPVAVDPDDRLRAHAQAHDWEIISLRN